MMLREGPVMITKDKTRRFKGKWISDGIFADIKPQNVFHRQCEPLDICETPKNKHILFRKTFMLSGFKKAEMFISADDYYKLYINGLPVTAGPCPGYPFHYYYNAVDVSDYLLQGENTIAVHTYYQGLINRVWVSGDGRHGLLLDLCVDGETVLCSDESFLCTGHTGYAASGKCGYDTQFLETYDSSAPETGFELPYFDDSYWETAKICKYDDHEMFLQPTEQLVNEPIKPVSVKRDGDRYFVDFGSVYVGYLFLAAHGEKGGKVKILCGQELDPDGNVRHKMRANCDYTEEWILSGSDDMLDQFDYKSFRYAEIIMPEGAILETADIRLIARHYPFELKAEPNTDDAQLLKIWNLCVHSLKYGVQENIMDCMEREKGQYVGDGVFTSAVLAVLTKDTAILEKLIDDALRSSFINRGLVTCTTCSFMQEIAEYSLMLPWLLCVHYHLKNDASFIEERYEKITDLLDYYRESYEKNEPGLLYDVDKWCVIDWPDTMRDGYDFSPKQGEVTHDTHNVISAYYIGAVKTVNRLSRIVGKPLYRDVQPLEESFIRAFYDEDSKLFRDTKESGHTSVPSNALPLLFDMCPDADCERNITEMIRNKGVTATNIFITFSVLAAVKRVGNDKLLYRLMGDEKGWLNMINEGATATFEAWGRDQKWNTSLFHLGFTYAAMYLTDWKMEDLLNGK